MKRLWTTVAAALVILLIRLPATAQEEFDTKAHLDAAGAQEMQDMLPQDARLLLEDTGITDMDYKQLLSLSPNAFFQAVWQMVRERMRMPLVAFGSVLGTIVLCSLLDSLKTSLWEGPLSSVFNSVAVICVGISVVQPVINCITQAASSIHACSNFILTFIPVLSSMMTVSGQPVTATTYALFLFAACQIASQVASTIFVPLMGVYLAFCLAGSLAPGMQIFPAARAVKSAVTWTLGLLMTLFVGLLSLQTMVAAGGDNVANRAAKFLIGSFVPVVGSALSEAFIATQGYLRLLRTTVGVFGILAALMTFLPVILQTCIWYLTVRLAGGVSEMLGIRQISELLKSTTEALGILLAVLLCFALLVVVSTTMVLILSSGV